MSEKQRQSNLRAFTSSGPRRPMLHKKEAVGPIQVESKGGIFPGYIGSIPSRTTTGFVQFCEREKHYHRNEKAYMLSDKVLAYLRAKGVTRILIAETDTGTVYEFHEKQFNTRVPQKAKGTNEKDEDQSLVRVSEYWGKWEEYADHVMLGSREVN